MADMGIHVHIIGWKKVTKVKSAIALHLKIHFMSCTNYVQNFMLLSKSAQFLTMLLYYQSELSCYSLTSLPETAQLS